MASATRRTFLAAGGLASILVGNSSSNGFLQDDILNGDIFYTSQGEISFYDIETRRNRSVESGEEIILFRKPGMLVKRSSGEIEMCTPNFILPYTGFPIGIPPNAEVAVSPGLKAAYASGNNLFVREHIRNKKTTSIDIGEPYMTPHNLQYPDDENLFLILNRKRIRFKSGKLEISKDWKITNPEEDIEYVPGEGHLARVKKGSVESIIDYPTTHVLDYHAQAGMIAALYLEPPIRQGPPLSRSDAKSENLSIFDYGGKTLWGVSKNEAMTGRNRAVNYRPRISPDGNRLSWIESRPERGTFRILIVDLKRKTLKKVLDFKDYKEDISELNWLNDSKSLVVTSSKGGRKTSEIIDSETAEIKGWIPGYNIAVKRQ